MEMVAVRSADRPGTGFRMAEPADRPFVARLGEAAFGHLGPGYGALLGGWVGAAEVATLVATSGGQPAGFAMLGLYEHERVVRADLLALAIVPEARRLGIGRALLDRAIALAERCAIERGAIELRLSVAEDNAAARALFSRAGFTPAEDEVHSYENGQVALRLRRALNG